MLTVGFDAVGGPVSGERLRGLFSQPCLLVRVRRDGQRRHAGTDATRRLLHTQGTRSPLVETQTTPVHTGNTVTTGTETDSTTTTDGQITEMRSFNHYTSDVNR